MVRRKRKGLVKESLAGGDATGAPPAADVRRVVAQLPLNAAVPFVVETDAKKPSNGAAPALDLAAWFALLADAPSRFEQLRLLQGFRAGVKRLSGAETGFAAFAEAAWRLFFRLLGAFDAGLEPLHKNFLLVLSDLVAIDSLDGAAAWGIEAVAREELRAALDALFAAGRSGEQNPEHVVKRLSHLQTLVEFPYVLKVLVRDSDDGSASSTLRRSVQFLADQLAVLVTPIAEYQAIHGDDNVETSINDEDETAQATDASSPTNAVLMASERASVALKCIIVLGSLKDVLYEQLVGAKSTFEDACVDFSRLLDHCALILKTRVVHKDLLTQTGLAYCLVFRLMLFGSLKSGVTANTAQADTIKFLMSAVYQADEVAAPAPIGQGPLLDHLKKDNAGFGDFARLAVFRGFINSLSDDELLLSATQLVQSESGSEQRSILDFVFATVHGYCGDESLNTRLYAFQVLEAFLRRGVGVISKKKEASIAFAPITQWTIANLTSVVLLNWENPSKRVNQFMHLMFSHIVTFQVLGGFFNGWKANAVTKLIQLPHHSRARYGGLSILVTQYGAATLLDEHPSLLKSILHAVGIKDVSAAAAGLFTQVLDELSEGGKRNDEVELSKLRQYWMADVVEVLLTGDIKLRSSVAMYALPLLLKKDPACVSVLIEQLRVQGSNNKDVSLWAIIEVLKFARRKISPEKLLGLSVVEIQQGLENSRPEARGAAFEALCASLKSTNLPSTGEVELIKRFLVLSAKEITASTRVNSLNGLKTVLFRVKEFLRINDKENINPRATEAEKQYVANEVARAKDFQKWMELFIITSVYPGSLVQRSIVGLEVLLLHLQVFGVPSVEDGSLLMTSHMVTCLLNMLIGSWDVIRALANTILDLYPANLPGFTTQRDLERLWKWALTLCISPRQRESDAGAHFMLLLYTRSQSLVAHSVADLPSRLPSGETVENAQVRLVLKLTDIITSRLETADISRGESPLVHGLLLSLRYIIDNTSFAQLQKRAEWKFALGRIFNVVHQSMKLSLAVVGDATSGVGDETLSDTFEGVVGEVSAAGGKTSAIPLRVDCRGHLILEDTENDAEGGDDADTEQRAVVGSWLAARECGAIVDIIMRRVPLPTNNDATDFFATELARQGGEMLLNSLFELKHKGAVATAYESFEGVCKSFLAHGEKNTTIGNLPSSWADKLLDRLERSEQQFILRRSSGFAYSFIAILRAEPRNTAAIILPRVMTNLLRLASQDTDAMSLNAAPHQQAHLVWRSRVHALNILKLISQDAVLSDDVAVYVAQMLEYAIFGFECRSWVVRNSSMMLFAAATQRALGDKRIADGASKNKIPSAEVFSRFPQLDGFLFRALERFTDTAVMDGTVPPGLFPVLMFLSRLRPTDEDEDEILRARGSKPLADFIPLILKCASQSVLAIRQMAAQVLGSIVRFDMALPILKQLSEALPQGVRSPVSPGADQPKPKTTNYVHGVLLQAQSLITKCLAEAETSTGTMKVINEILTFVVTDFLPAHLWLSTVRVKCASIRAVVWEIVESVFQLHASTPDLLSLDKVIETVTTAVLKTVDALTTDSESSRAPGDYNCNRAVVGTFFSLLTLHWTPLSKDAPFVKTWISRLEALLQARVLEVRKRAFKKLIKFIHTGDFDFGNEVAVVASLQAVLLKQLVIETHPTVKTRLLQLLIEIQDSTAATKVPLSANAVAIDTFLNLLASSANVDVVGPVLRLLASAIREGVTSEAALLALKNNVIERSSETQPLGLRFSAAVAIERSDLLLAHVGQKNGTVDIALDAWTAAIKLLQDDDSHVRDVIRKAVHRALASADNAFSLDSSVSETALVPVAIRFFVKTFSTSSKGIEVIKSMVLETVDAPSVLIEYSTGAKAQDWGDLSTRIFEAEGNNFYAEADLIAQLFAGCVFEQPNSTELKAAVLDKLLLALTVLNDSRTREQWLGGMTYYASVFPTFFSLLCVSIAALTSLTDAERVTYAGVVKSIQDQASVSHSFLNAAHPLVTKALAEISAGAKEPKAIHELLFLTPQWTAIN